MTQDVGIIGAGLAGLGLALALDAQGIKATVYENRPAPLNIGGAVMLSPNALKIFDELGFYQDVQRKGYNFEVLDFKTTSGELLDTYEFGNIEKYGYNANRIYRHELIDIILNKIKSRGIKVKYGHKFSHVISETNNSVTWQFTDGTNHTASLLVGADGIHSTVRKYLYPNLHPKFIGITGITAAIPSSNLPPSINKINNPLTLLSKTEGAFVIAPQKVDGSEYLIGKQKRMPDQTRDEWSAIQSDKESAIKFLQQDNEIFGPIAVNATVSVPTTNINIWPFYTVPKLDSWTSQHRRVILVGDAAHAIPPSAGQGISQAFEDVYMLSLLFAAFTNTTKALTTQSSLNFWQEFRQSRLEKVLALNHQIDERRLPKEADTEDRNQGSVQNVNENEKMEWDLGWLYGVDLKVVVGDWVRSQRQD